MHRLAFLALLLTGPLVSAQTLKKGDHDALVQMLKQAVADREVRGASLLVVVKGKVIFKEAAGSLKTSDAVRIASSTKPTTTTALMILVEAGKVKLDDAIVKYLPEFKGTTVEKATVRQLMSHTAGVPGFYPGGQRPTSGTLAEFSKRVAKSTLRKPGSFSYSGVGMDLCARICEVASGTTYEAHFKKSILDPLGMKDTTFTMAAKKADTKGNDGRWVSGGGGLSSTLDDLAAFYQMHLDRGVYKGKRLLSAKNIAEMHRKHASNPARSGPPFGSDYGLGFYLDRFTKDGEVMTINHAGALGTVAWLDKDRDLVGVLFAPGTLRQATALIGRVMKKVRDIVPATRKVEIVEAKPAAAKFDHAAEFKKMAAGKDKVTKETFAKYMGDAATGFAKGRTELWKRIFDRLDTDEDGSLTLKEFKKYRGLRR